MGTDFTCGSRIGGIYLAGHFRKDQFGRIVIDQCASDEEHLRNSVAPPGVDRAKCRVLLEDLFRDLIGKTGLMFIDNIEFEEEELCGRPTTWSINE